MIKTLFSKKFFLDLVERVIATGAGAAIATIGTTALVERVDWKVVGSVTALAMLVSFLKGLIASFKGDPDSASLVD